MTWKIEPHDYGVDETLVYAITGYIIRAHDQDFKVLGVGRNGNDWPGMELVPVDDEQNVLKGALTTVMPFAHDIEIEVY